MSTMSTEMEMRKAEEYEMQLFGFTSRAVCATLDRIVEEKIQMCGKKLSMSLNKISKPDESDTLALRQDVKSLVKIYLLHFHQQAKIMKNLIRKLITVPSNVLLEEDECQAITYSQEPKDMEKHLKDLQARAKKAMVLQAALKEELKAAEEIEAHSDVVQTVSTVIENSLEQPEVQTEMIKCVSSCHAIENIVTKSCNKATNIYANDIYNVQIVELDLESSKPRVLNNISICNES